MQEQTVNILLAEDDDIDARVVKRGLAKEEVDNPVFVARDGVEALEILRGEAGHEALEGPRLILLDLNMPRMGGIEFLEELRSDPELSNSIVFVLTTSDDERDRMAAYQQQVAGYLLKSDADDAAKSHFPMLKKYINAVQFPEGQPAGH